MGLGNDAKTMRAKIATNVASEKSPVLRVMPLFVKNIAMKAVFDAVGECKAQELPLGRMLERELYEGLEVCCRELGDYQQAYLYASKQLAMQKETGKETRT